MPPRSCPTSAAAPTSPAALTVPPTSRRPSRPTPLLRRRILLGAAAGASLLSSRAATGQAASAWPSRSVRIVVPYPAGGGVDILARALGQALAARWGQPVVIENKPGANTLIGVEAVARAGDDHQLLLTTDATFTINPHLYAKLPYAREDFAPVAMLARFSQVMVASPALPADDVAALVALAKAKPGTLTYASYGPGSQPHLATEMFKHRAGIAITHVPYRGIPQAVAAAASGEVSLTWSGLPSAQPHFAAGRLKPIGYGGRERLAAFPALQTFAEAGFPEVDANVWVGLFAPAAMTPAAQQRMHDDVRSTLREPDFHRRQLVERGYDPGTLGLAAFGRFIDDERRSRAEAVRISGAKAE